MIGIVIVFALLLSALLGLLALAVLLLWRRPYLTLPWKLCILSGSLGVACMLGLLGHAAVLVCLQTTCF
jgi:hypothetical protein